MPNWTQNYVALEGSKEKIVELKKFFASDERVFDFNKILPMPENSDTFFAEGSLGEKERQKFGDNNWYTWSAKNWGTKWNAVEPNLDVDNECKLEYSFRTAWDAPRGVIDELWHSGILNGCTNITWECSHEFEYDIETFIGKRK